MEQEKKIRAFEKAKKAHWKDYLDLSKNGTHLATQHMAVYNECIEHLKQIYNIKK